MLATSFEALLQNFLFSLEMFSARHSVVRLASKLVKFLVTHLVHLFWGENIWQVGYKAALDREVDDIVGKRPPRHLSLLAARYLSF